MTTGSLVFLSNLLFCGVNYFSSEHKPLFIPIGLCFMKIHVWRVNYFSSKHKLVFMKRHVCFMKRHVWRVSYFYKMVNKDLNIFKLSEQSPKNSARNFRKFKFSNFHLKNSKTWIFKLWNHRLYAQILLLQLILVYTCIYYTIWIQKPMNAQFQSCIQTWICSRSIDFRSSSQNVLRWVWCWVWRQAKRGHLQGCQSLWWRWEPLDWDLAWVLLYTKTRKIEDQGRKEGTGVCRVRDTTDKNIYGVSLSSDKKY